ncbi:DUF2976 domain-containing protein [Photobacterium leiognathi]|uniref:DUF2976 domain-containing protein n=1 Tax=Photobacterium leiognathi TaxID=553611 RepID=UPI0029829485|nr:DUF2976 domain-containing protein [Photobacterium leiognathi]
MKKINLFWQSLLFTLSLVMVHPARAVIPGNQDPSQGGDDENILKVLFAYGYDAVLYGGGLGLAAAIGYYIIHMWAVFKEVRAQRKEKSDFISDGVIGALLILLSIWAVNFCLSILEKAS